MSQTEWEKKLKSRAEAAFAAAREGTSRETEREQGYRGPDTPHPFPHPSGTLYQEGNMEARSQAAKAQAAQEVASRKQHQPRETPFGRAAKDDREDR
jgi:hypothetical protein